MNLFSKEALLEAATSASLCITAAAMTIIIVGAILNPEKDEVPQAPQKLSFSPLGIPPLPAYRHSSGNLPHADTELGKQLVEDFATDQQSIDNYNSTLNQIHASRKGN